MVVYGAGGHAKVVIDILESNGIKIDYLVDDNSRIKELCGYKVRRDGRRYDEVIVAIGSSESRKEVYESMQLQWILLQQFPTEPQSVMELWLCKVLWFSLVRIWDSIAL